MDRLKTAEKPETYRTLLFALLVLLFSLPAVMLTRTDSRGPTSQKAVELWQKQDWHALRSLGENLYETGRSDVEILYLAMLASRELNHTEGVRTFAQRVLEARPLNWKVERVVATLYRPDSTFERLALFRARLIYLLSALLFLVGLWSLHRRRPLLIPAAVLSLAGLFTLFL